MKDIYEKEDLCNFIKCEYLFLIRFASKSFGVSVGEVIDIVLDVNEELINMLEKE